MPDLKPRTIGPTLRERSLNRVRQEIATEEETKHKAALAAGALAGEENIPAYEELETEVVSRRSAILQEVKEQAESRRKAELNAAAESIVADPRIPKQQKVQVLEQVSTEPTDVSLKDQFDYKIAQQATTTTSDSSARRDSIVDYITMRIELPDMVEQIIREEVTFDSEDAVLDTVSAVALPGHSIQLYEVLNQAMPEVVRPGDAVLTGNLKERFAEKFNSLSTEEQEQAIRRLAKAVEKNTFFGTDNGFVKRDVLVTLLGDIKPSNAEKLFLNAIGILDILAVTEFIRMGRALPKALRSSARAYEKAGKLVNNLFSMKKPYSAAGKIDKISPQDGKRLSERVLAGEVPAENVGETAVSFTVDNVTPKPAAMKATASPDLNEDVDRVMGYDGRSLGWTEAEELGLENRALTRIRSIKSVAPAVHLNKTQVETIPGGVRTTTYIGGIDVGFSSVKKAKSAQRKLRDQYPTELYVTDVRDNKLYPRDDVPTEFQAKEYWLKFTEEVKLSPEEAVAINPIRPDGTTGLLAKYLTKSSFLADWAAGAGSVLGDTKAARFKALSEMLAPVFRLPTRKRVVVEDLIDRGDQAGKFFTDEELYLELGQRSDYGELVDAYGAFKRFQQVQWRLVNDGIKERLESGGFKHIYLPNKADGNMLGRPVAGNDLPRDLDRVYDPATDSIRPLTPEELETIEASRVTARELGEDLSQDFIELRRPYQKGGESATYIVNTGKRDQVRIFKLPDEVIKNIPGRIPRLYDAHYMVKHVVDTVVDGKPTKGGIPVAVARNSGEARRLANELEESHPDYNPQVNQGLNRRYDYTKADELTADTEYAERTSVDYYEDSGQLWLSDRGLELDAVDGTRPLRPVLERLELAMQRSSRIGTIDLLVDKLTKNFNLEYGRDIGRMQDLPLYGPLGENLKNVSERRIRDAEAFRDHIKLLAGIHEGMLERLQRRTAVYVADELATPGTQTILEKSRNKLATGIIRARNFDLINLSKQAAFLQFIVGNPIRQIALQSQQASVYLTEGPGMAGLRYFTSGEGIRHYNALTSGLGIRDNIQLWEQLSPSLANMANMSRKEYEEFVDAFRSTGIFQNIDSHAFAAGMLTDKTYGGGAGFLRGVGADVFNGSIRGAKMIRRLGFDVGEKMHLVTGFLAVRNNWIKANPKKNWADPKNLAEIHARTRAISFEMTREGALGFQKGLLGLIFQFSSHNFKAMQALLPQNIPVVGKLSNKAFSNKQKRALLLTQSSLYGFGGYGAYEAYDYLKSQIQSEIPQEIDMALKEGIFGSLVNVLGRAATDEPFSLDVSGNIAPFSGVQALPIYEIIGDAIALGHFDITEIPSLGVGKDIYDTIQSISFLTGRSFPAEELDISPVERVGLVADDILRLMPLYNKFMKSRAEQKIGALISNKGDVRAEVGDLEILGNTLFGFQPTADRQAFELRKEIEGLRAGGFRNDPINKDLREYSANIYMHVKRTLQRTGDLEAGRAEVSQTIRAVARHNKELLTEDEYNLVHKKYIPELMYTDLSKGSQSSQLIKLFQSKLVGRELRTTDSVVNELGQSEVLRNNPRIAKFFRELGE